MAYTGITTRQTTCAICQQEIPTSTLVYCDETKRQGSHIAHVMCWDDLRATRAGMPKEKPKTKPAKQSSEPLDPPF